jgi:hypothetical protein
MRLMHKPFFLLIIFILSSCAVGNQHNYHDTIANITTTGSITVATATHDQRQHILSGQSPPNYVGMQRGGWGNPFNVTTASGKPLADDITTSICNSLSSKGFKAVAVSVSHSDSRDKIMEKMKEAESERLLLFTLNEWQSDTYTNTGLSYDVKIEVFNSNGKRLAEKSIKGDDNLGGSFMNPPAHAKEVIPKAFREKIEVLLNSEDILKTLR